MSVGATSTRLSRGPQKGTSNTPESTNKRKKLLFGNPCLWQLDAAFFAPLERAKAASRRRTPAATAADGGGTKQPLSAAHKSMRAIFTIPKKRNRSRGRRNSENRCSNLIGHANLSAAEGSAKRAKKPPQSSNDRWAIKWSKTRSEEEEGINQLQRQFGDITRYNLRESFLSPKTAATDLQEEETGSVGIIFPVVITTF